MVDHLTGWPIPKAIPNKEATTVANTIFEKCILEHGAPEILISNNGTGFTNDTLAYVCQEFNIEQHFTSPYTPRPNGKTEKFNKFLKASIRSYVLRTLWHGIRSWTRSYLCTGAVLTHLQERHPIHFCITGIHHYQYRN